MTRKHELTERGQFYDGTDYGDDAMVLACWCGEAVVAEWDYRRNVMVPGTRPRRIAYGGIDQARVIELDYRRREYGPEVKMPSGKLASRLLVYIRDAVLNGELRNHPYAERGIRNNPEFDVGVDKLGGRSGTDE